VRQRRRRRLIALLIVTAAILLGFPVLAVADYLAARIDPLVLPVFVFAAWGSCIAAMAWLMRGAKMD